VNLYYRKSFDDITKNITKFFGWKTTSTTRPFALAALKAVFLRKNSGFPQVILNEMITFLRNAKGKPEALAGKNDDVVMAASIAYSVMQEHGAYESNSSSNESFSMAKAMYGENQGGTMPLGTQQTTSSSGVRELWNKPWHDEQKVYITTYRLPIRMAVKKMSCITESTCHQEIEDEINLKHFQSIIAPVVENGISSRKTLLIYQLFTKKERRSVNVDRTALVLYWQT